MKPFISVSKVDGGYNFRAFNEEKQFLGQAKTIEEVTEKAFELKRGFRAPTPDSILELPDVDVAICGAAYAILVPRGMGMEIEELLPIDATPELVKGAVERVFDKYIVQAAADRAGTMTGDTPTEVAH